MIKQLLAILFIYISCSVAWAILGGTVLSRTYSSDSSASQQVDQLWGTPQSQHAPNIYYETKEQVQRLINKDGKMVTETTTETEQHKLPIDDGTVRARLNLDYRQKGLLWYSTYKVHFSGAYDFKNPTTERQLVHVDFPLPAQSAIYDNLQMTIGTQTLSNIVPNANSIPQTIMINPGESKKVTLSYDSQGQGNWQYTFASNGSDISQVKNFTLSLVTNFNGFDFPEGSMSPTEKKKLENGWELTWNYKNLLTGYNIGMKLPQKLNPGPWVSKVTFFAPISLFLFFFFLFVFTTIKGIKLHPMNYFFLSAAFFSFHLLLAYLADHTPIMIAFGISSLVSILLVVSYMRLVVSSKFAFVEVGLSQLIYLIGFSYTFFFEEYTGLVITILCILTLFIMMQFTGRIDWEDVFRKAGTSKANGNGVTPQRP